jgi:Methyltransferase domain
MNRDLNRFVDYFHNTTFESDMLFNWLENVYAGVFPISLTDEDLPKFLTVIYLAVRFFKPKIIVQTGTFIGTSSLVIAKSCEENSSGTLITIDPEPLEYFGVEHPVNAARKAAEKSDLMPRIKFLHGYSTIPYDGERMQLVHGNTWLLNSIACSHEVDMFVVDGDHTYDGCYNDLHYGSQSLRNKGPKLFIVHDYLGIPSVRRAVKDFIGTRPDSTVKIVPSPCGIALIQLN